VILGEGAAAVVLEPVGRAVARAAAVLATVRGVGTSCDAHHVTAPLAAGVTRAMRDGHRRAGVKPADIDLILAHGTGTLLNDRTEAEVLAAVFADRRPPVTALKSLIGHTSGASGLMSLVTAVRALDTGQAPPTRGHGTPIPEIREFPVVTGEPLRAPLGTVQVNAFGFGGVNAVAVLDRAVPAVAPAPPAGGRAVVVTGVGHHVPGVGRHVPGGIGWADDPADEPAAVLGRRGLRYKDRATVLALAAAARALHAAGHVALRDGICPPDAGEPRTRFGVVVATELGLVDTVSRVVTAIHAGGVSQTSPMDLPNASGNVASAQLAIWFRLGGMNLTLSCGPTSGIDALHHAATAIRAGRADRMLVVGAEPATEAAVRLLRDTARRHGEDAPRVVLDGAAAVVLEAAEVAAGPALAEIGGYARGRAPEPPSGWFWAPPCRGHGERPSGGAGGAGAEIVDLGPAVGEASGALGVLQCAAIAPLLAGTGRDGLIVAGGCWGAGHATLTLRGPA
jgi:3-oxoacyl-(acyl-carrier-protein) synthase